MAESFIKRLELAVRRRYNTWVTRGGDPLVVDAPVAQSIVKPNARILLLRQDRIGDVLVSTPIIAAIRACYPNATIGMVLSTNNTAVAYAVEPYVDRIHVFRKSVVDLVRLRRKLRRSAYDVVIDLMDNPSSTSALLMQGSRAPIAIGVDKENRRVYTHVVPLADRTAVHIVERIARITWPLGFDIPREELRPKLPGVTPHTSVDPHAGPNQSYILGINISGSDLDRMYPESLLAEVLRQVCSSFEGARTAGQLELVIMSAPHHREIAERIGQQLDVRVVPPMASFSDFAKAIGQCDMFLTPDTSAVHVAAAYNIPSVVLFAQDDRLLLPWFPYATRNWACIAHNAPLAAIPTSDVVRHLTRMIHEITGLKPGAS